MAEDDKIKTYKGRIVAINSLGGGTGIHCDSISVELTFEGKKILGEFVSPYLSPENILGWRRIVMQVVWSQKIPASDPALKSFDAYKQEMMNAPVVVAYHPEHGLFGIGKVANNLFYPIAYGLTDAAAAQYTD